MKKLVILALLTSLLTVYCPPAARASQVTLFVHNVKFTNPTIFSGGVLYAPLESLFKAMRYGWSQKGVNVKIISATASPIPPITGNKLLTFSFRGKTFTPAMFRKGKGGVIYVSVPDMAKGLQAQYKLNGKTGIAKVLIAEEIRQEEKAVVSAKSEAAKSEEAKSEEAQNTQASGQSESTSIQEEKPPLEMKVDAYAERDMSGTSLTYFRPRATIKNTSAETVKNVVVTLHYQDPNGKDLNSETKSIGDMAPGQEVTYDYYWVNSSGIEVAVFLTEEHEKPNKK